MPLHPQAKAFMDQAGGAPAIHLMPVAAARAMFDAMAALAGPPEPVAAVQDAEVPGPYGTIPIRVYYPRSGANLPVAIWYHAGGFTLGGFASHDPLLRTIVNRADAAVVAVDYRRAPEHRFPAAHDEAWAVLQWITRHGAALNLDPSRLALCGDSVGGGLATVMALRARAEGGPRARVQILVYPDVDWRFNSPSWTTMSRDYFVTREAAEWFRANYLPDPATWTDWRASPLLAESLADLPPALVVCPEFNPARSDMEAYAARLAAAGVPTEFWLAEGMVMGFVSMAAIIDDGARAVHRISARLREALG